MTINPKLIAPSFSACYEFVILNVNIGVTDLLTLRLAPATGEMIQFFRDTIKIETEGRLWLLRHPIDYKNNLVPADSVFGNASSDERIEVDFNLKNAILQTPIDGMEREEAMARADELTTLLSFCFGQNVVWHEMGIRRQHVYQVLIQRTVTISSKASGSPPISNNGDGNLQRFFDGAWPVYCEDKTWWRYTIRWFTIACEAHIVEVSGIIFSMLMERISKKVVSKISDLPEWQIGQDLADAMRIKETQERIISSLSDVMRPYAQSWNDERSRSLLNTIKGWNSRGSYKSDILAACSFLKLTPPSGVVTKSRDDLMHAGMLKQDLSGNHTALSRYDCDVHEIVQVMLLAMFGYQGHTFVPGKRDCSMADFYT